MRRTIPGHLVLPLLCALVLTSAACGNSLSTTPSPTPVTTTEDFSGTISKNGAVTHTFTTLSAGSVTATLNTLAPDATITIGLSLGTWNGDSCQTVIAKDNAIVTTAVVGAASAAGSFCIRVYDAAGTLAATTSYVVQVVHP